MEIILKSVQNFNILKGCNFFESSFSSNLILVIIK